MLGSLAPAEEVQHHHEAGGVWRARGDAEVSGGHSRTGNDDGVIMSVEVIFPLPVIISYFIVYMSVLSFEAVHSYREVHLPT